MGAVPPGPPFCPPPLAEGLPAFWAPLVAGLQGWATRPSFGFVGGHPPQPPAMGASPPGPHFAHPRWLRVCQGFGPHSWQGYRGGLLAPLLVLWGDTPHSPPPWGLCPLDPPFCPPPLGGELAGSPIGALARNRSLCYTPASKVLKEEQCEKVYARSYCFSSQGLQFWLAGLQRQPRFQPLSRPQRLPQLANLPRPPKL